MGGCVLRFGEEKGFLSEVDGIGDERHLWLFIGRKGRRPLGHVLGRNSKGGMSGFKSRAG